MQKNRQKIQMTASGEKTVREAFELFIRKCNVKNLSAETIKSYKEKNKFFIEYVGEDSLIGSVNENTFDNFILHMRESGTRNSTTINSYIRSLRAFLYYCMKSGWVHDFDISEIKCEKVIKETYSDEELIRLLQRPDGKECTFTEFKIWVFENYLLGTGNRISTALNLRVEDINFSDGVIILRKTKNRKQQIIPLSGTLAGILKEYLVVRGGEKEDYVFCNVYGEKGDKRTFQEQVQEYNISRGVNKTSCHLFRHTFAKQWILAGGDVFRLQKIMGHSSIAVTKEYVAMFGQDLQLDFEKFNPLDNMKISKKIIRM